MLSPKPVHPLFGHPATIIVPRAQYLCVFVGVGGASGDKACHLNIAITTLSKAQVEMSCQISLQLGWGGPCLGCLGDVSLQLCPICLPV